MIFTLSGFCPIVAVSAHLGPGGEVSILASCSPVRSSDSLGMLSVGWSVIAVGLVRAWNIKKKIRIYLIVSMYGTMYGTMYTYSMYFELKEWWLRHNIAVSGLVSSYLSNDIQLLSDV